MTKTDLLKTAVGMAASDIILLPGAPPMARIEGRVVPITPGAPELNAEQCKAIIYSDLSEFHRASFEENLELDYAFAIPGVCRFRANSCAPRSTALPGWDGFVDAYACTYKAVRSSA